MKLKNLRLILSLRCEEASQLVSESLDRQLTATERWALRMHTFVCPPCRRLVRQLRAMRDIISNMPAALRVASRGSITQLSAERRREIKRLMNEPRQLESN